MDVYALLAFAAFLVLISSMIVLLGSSISLGLQMKRIDPSRYKAIYFLFVPFSSALLFNYVRSSENISKYPESSSWLITVIRYSMVSLFISFVFMGFSAFLAAGKS